MTSTHHYEAHLQPQSDSECVVIIDGDNLFLPINYDIAVETYLQRKEPLSVTLKYQGEQLAGSYSAKSINSIRLLTDDELRKKAAN